MTGRWGTLERIATALERLAPPVASPQDWLGAPAYIWTGEGARAVDRLDALALASLRGIDAQKSAFTVNIERLAKGAAAHDTLLWGARGMGKSALVRAAVADMQARAPAALALVQINSAALETVPALLAQLARVERSFLLFVDDLGFGTDQKSEMLSIRSLLDGGVTPRPARVRVVVTSNRRAIVERDADEAEALHERDARDDALALADRFGLKLGFHPCDRETYLEILRAYAEPRDLAFDEEEALAFAIERGNRSGRTAYQFATELAGRAGIAL
jgi:predicted AAA+ superfamily ATPase